MAQADGYENAAEAFASSAAGDGIANQPTSIIDRVSHGETVSPLDTRKSYIGSQQKFSKLDNAGFDCQYVH